MDGWRGGRGSGGGRCADVAAAAGRLSVSGLGCPAHDLTHAAGSQKLGTRAAFSPDKMKQNVYLNGNSGALNTLLSYANVATIQFLRQICLLISSVV